MQLKAEILKLRTYPIPEPWCSFLMRKGMTHTIEGEFVFYVWPEVNEDMNPLILTDRDLLPGGLTRAVYNTRLERMRKEIKSAIGVWEDTNVPIN